MDEKIFEVLNRSLINISQSTVDKYIEENVKFRSEAGLKAKIIRSTNGKCCNWCTSLAGVYKYPVPEEVYQRHDNCNCKVTYVTEKGAKDVHTKKNLKKAELEERLRLLEENKVTIPSIFEDVKEEYFKNISKGLGKTTIQPNVRRKNEKWAIENAEILSEFFGEEIIILEESNIPNKPNPDYLWRGKYWDQKKVSTVKALDTAVRTGMNQIIENPGGIVIDISDVDGTLNDIYNKIACRIGRRKYDNSIDIILIENNRIVSIIRHKKR